MAIKAPLESAKKVVYEVIRREDLLYAFKAALDQSNAELVTLLNQIVEQQINASQSGLWTWDGTSRYDFDVWS